MEPRRTVKQSLGVRFLGDRPFSMPPNGRPWSESAWG